MSRASRPLLSVALMLGATASFVAMQSVVKVARLEGLGTPEVMFWRTAPGLPVLWWSLRRRGEGLTPAEPLQLAARSVLGAIAMGTNFASMLRLSVAQFTTLHLMQPVFVALFAPLVLSETMRRSTWVALGLAMAGALCVVAPGLDSSQVPLGYGALALGSALASAFAQMWVRKATASDPAERVVFYFAAFVSVVFGGVSLVQGRLLPALDRTLLALLVLGMAGFGTLGQVLMTKAYSHAEAARVSVVAYAGIILGLFADIAFFGTVPSALAVAGAALVVAAGAALVRGAREG